MAQRSGSDVYGPLPELVEKGGLDDDLSNPQPDTVTHLGRLGGAIMGNGLLASQETGYDANRQRQVALGVHVAKILFSNDPEQFGQAYAQASGRQQ